MKICPKCKMKLEKGTAIKPEQPQGCWNWRPMIKDPVPLIECWKCPDCGHSETIDE